MTSSSLNQSTSSIWSPLKKGDKVEVIAPGSGCLKLEFKWALSFLRNWGLVPKVKKNLLKEDLFYSNSHTFRFKHLKEAFEASDSKVIFCLRGGYGSNHLLSKLEAIKKPPRVKLLVGFSDITFLHSFLNYKWKWPSLYASNLIYLIRKKNQSSSVFHNDIMALKRLLFGRTDLIEVRDLKPLNQSARKIKNLRFPVAGGNLRVLSSLIGTPWIQCLKSKIVILEDVNERAYSVDRMLFQWQTSGMLKSIKALIFGNFLFSKNLESQKKQKKEQRLLKEAIQRLSQNLKIPIFKTFAFGHGKKQRPIPFMTKAEIFPVKKGKKNSFYLRIARN